MNYLEGKWRMLTAFNKNETLKQSLYNELIASYSQPNRFYHNLSHIGNLFYLFEQHVAVARNPAVICFAIFYHDVVYDTLRNDNEEQSAGMARNHLAQLKLKSALIDRVVQFILCAKHQAVGSICSGDQDLDLFLDLDLAVLAEDWQDYEVYSSNIRKEFKQYTPHTFQAGRKHALQQILQKEAIYHLPQFREAFETKARQNLHREISLLWWVLHALHVPKRTFEYKTAAWSTRLEIRLLFCTVKMKVK